MNAGIDFRSEAIAPFFAKRTHLSSKPKSPINLRGNSRRVPDSKTTKRPGQHVRQRHRTETPAGVSGSFRGVRNEIDQTNPMRRHRRSGAATQASELVKSYHSTRPPCPAT